MKIYTKIRIDIDTGKVIEEESFDYEGPLAKCDGSDSDGGYGSIGGPPGVSSRDASRDYWSRIAGTPSFDPSADHKAANAAMNPYAGANPDSTAYGGVGTPSEQASAAAAASGKATAESVSSTYSSPSAWDTFKDIAQLVARAFSTITAGLSGDIVGAITQGEGFYDHLTDMLAKYDDTRTAVTQALSDFNLSTNDYNVNQITSAVDSSLNEGGGRELIDSLSSTRKTDAPGVVNPSAATNQTGANAQNYKFTSYEDALRYATGSAAQRADEAWDMYKEYVVPYEKEFYNQARTLIDPQMELSRQYLDSQIQQMPGYTESAIKFREEAINGVNPEERANQAQAEVEQALKNADQTAMRSASRMGLDLNDSSVLDNIKTTSLDRARGVSGARTMARNNAETENFQRLGMAASMVPGSGQQGISFAQGNVTNPVSTAANQSSQAMGGAQSGLSFQQGESQFARQLAQNEPYKPSFGDMLVNTALSGLSKTDWSKVF